MAQTRVLVLRAAGINCDEEMMYCWQVAGANATLMHINALAAEPSALDEFDILTIPGGFSYGDDIAAGIILAQRLVYDVAESMTKLVERGGGILGICNGFQALVKAGLLPGGNHGGVTVTYNDSAKFEARWVKLQVAVDNCPFLKPGSVLEMPVEHAEGKVVTQDEQTATDLAKAGLVAIRYVDDEGKSNTYPANPNGSMDGIAGLCDATGRIFGMMPHPDRHFAKTNHPRWTSRQEDATPDGLTIFENAVAAWG